jgi:hypothetical protein
MSAPRIARLLIRLSSPPDRREDTLGDLEEAHRRRVTGGSGRAWFATVREACVIALMLTWDRFRPAGVDRGGRLLSATDVRLGFRLMHKQPVLTVTAVVALAVGIGLATVGFAFMEATQFGRLLFDGGDRFVTLQVSAEAGGTSATLDAAEYRALSAQATTLEYLGAMSGSRENVILPSGQVAVATTAGIAPSLQRYLPYRPATGRLLTRADGLPGAEPVAIIRHRFWRNILAESPHALGSRIEVAGVPRTIVGIAPDDFEFPNSPDLWFPIDDGFLQGRGAPDSDLRLLGILAPGRSIHTAQDQLNTIAAQFSATRAPDRAVRMEVAGFTDLGPIAAGLSAGVIAMVLLVLIVIAANVGNLILARSFARSREFALRAALGAARRQLVGQVFLEVLLIAGTAAVMGSLAASVALRYFSQMDEIPFWVNFTGGPRTMILVAGATVLAAAVAGIWPALRATRRDLAGSLEGGGRSSDVRFGRTAGVLVTLQIALSIAMLHGALIFAQGLSHFTGESLPLPRNVVTTYLRVARPKGSRPMPMLVASTTSAPPARRNRPTSRSRCRCR